MILRVSWVALVARQAQVFVHWEEKIQGRGVGSEMDLTVMNLSFHHRNDQL